MLAQDKYWDGDGGGILEFSENNSRDYECLYAHILFTHSVW